MEDRLIIGCCYYPEHWPEAQMESDIARIKALGFNTVRMGEFSWSLFEREEGKYDFSYLQKAVSMAEKAGLYVILGTPTAAPPKWLIDRYPEVLCVAADRTVMQHGSRQQHNHTSPVYLKYCEAITEAMVMAFRDYSNVIGWQLDNEFNCHRNESYSEADDVAFRSWLQAKYTTVERLNDAWGTRFWSLEYNDFYQVECPRPTPTHRNPSVMTDYYLFLSDTVVNYAAVQTRVIRRLMPRAFITHNGYFANIDYKKLTDECLDLLSFDSYPAFQEKNGIGLGRNVAYKLALTRSCSEKYIIMEQQSGPGGQLSYLLPTPLPGQIRLWTYQSIAHGAVGVLYFRYRTALYGAEQLWYGIYDHDGGENYRSREVRQVAQELQKVGHLFLNNRKIPVVGIWLDYHNTCCIKAEPYFKDDSWEIYTALNQNNVQADFVRSLNDISNYRVMIFPHVAIADEAMMKCIEAFTQAGGIAILSSRCGVKDVNAHYRPLKAPGVFRYLTGCEVEWFTAIPQSASQGIQMAGKTYGVDTYCEVLSSTDAETVATYTEGFCQGKPSVVKRGNVYYVGFYSHNGAELYYDLVRQFIAVEPILDKALEVVNLGAYKMYLNHSNAPVAIAGFDCIRQAEFSHLEPFGVALIQV